MRLEVTPARRDLPPVGGVERAAERCRRAQPQPPRIVELDRRADRREHAPAERAGLVPDDELRVRIAHAKYSSATFLGTTNAQASSTSSRISSWSIAANRTTAQ